MWQWSTTSAGPKHVAHVPLCAPHNRHHTYQRGTRPGERPCLGERPEEGPLRTTVGHAVTKGPVAAGVLADRRAADGPALVVGTVRNCRPVRGHPLNLGRELFGCALVRAHADAEAC